MLKVQQHGPARTSSRATNCGHEAGRRDAAILASMLLGIGAAGWLVTQLLPLRCAWHSPQKAAYTRAHCACGTAAKPARPAPPWHRQTL